MLTSIYGYLPSVISLAESISRNHEEILRLWLEVADQAQSARGLSHPAFVNMIGVYLTALATGPDEESDRQLLLEQHLSIRLRQGFELAEILGEIAALGHSVSQVWTAADPEQRPAPVQMRHFYARLRRDAVLVTSVFRSHMLEDEQREKRFRLLIRGVAEAALQPSASGLAERYNEVLELVMQSTQAQSVSLLLLGPENTHLWVAASVGLGRKEMQGALAGTLLARSSQEFLVDPVREVEVSSALRKVGILSLLSAPLAPHSSDALGVLVIGSNEERSFSPRERRHLEALTEQVSFHLESARLFANLASTVYDLQRERGLRELFVAVLAHDLRGPLAASKLAAQLMLEPGRLELGELAELGLTVNRNIDRMDRLVQDLLDVSLVTAGQPLPMHRARCDLGQLAVQVVDELRPLCSGSFELNCQGQVVGFWSQDSLRRAMWNLISNAVKYGRSGTPITVTVERAGRGGRFLVHNEGTAISPADQANLFAPFSRTLEAQESGKQGWGLGLALVHACIEAHGGVTGVCSQPGMGTTFYFELPDESEPGTVPPTSTNPVLSCRELGYPKSDPASHAPLQDGLESGCVHERPPSDVMQIAGRRIGDLPL